MPTQRPYDPNTWLLLLDITGAGTDPTDFDLVVCLENWSNPSSRAEIESKTMCGADKRVGVPSYGPITFDGQIILSAATGKLGLIDLQTLFTNKTKVAWKLSPITPVEGDVVESGFGEFSKFDKSAGTDTEPKFSAAITILGTPTYTETPA